MTCVRFGLGSDNSMILGPAPAYVLSGDVLCVGPHWPIVAVYRNSTWEVRGHHFVRFNFTERGLMLADFNRAPDGSIGRFGPFDEIVVADSVLFADDKHFAKFREDTFSWYVYEMKTCLLNIIIKAACSSPLPS
jgi:hypothetical protein